MQTDVATNLKAVATALPQGVKLIAVSKFHSASSISEAYNVGQRAFGESQVQELVRKVAVLPKDIVWHFIGHLQTNKVKYIAPYIGMIHSVDSLKLLREIDKQAERFGRTIDVLLQVHLAQEESKWGFSPNACRDLLDSDEWRALRHVRICGLMTMASFTSDVLQIAGEFETAARLFAEFKANYFAETPSFCERSWGMSDDYGIAIRHQATMVRVGTAIFGERNYESEE